MGFSDLLLEQLLPRKALLRGIAGDTSHLWVSAVQDFFLRPELLLRADSVMSHHCFGVEAQSWHFFVDLELQSAARRDISTASIVMSTEILGW